MELGTGNKVLEDELTTEVQTAGVASAATPISQDAQLYSTLALMIANKATSETAPSQSTDIGSGTTKSMDSSSQTSEAKNHESSSTAQASLENLVVANGLTNTSALSASNELEATEAAIMNTESDY
ncbi:hypothetical protein [Streptococcus vestibularis]|uniref:Uncharacterized protein n=1 Tax=Streptococcus vestibularis TaxID=1343 RepID=A0A564S800_STRVE|nr:hypothetical protein [Streptococcus vestibularis]VUW91255.1 Uncharacterised protein [Streptococcus vestibularis]